MRQHAIAKATRFSRSNRRIKPAKRSILISSKERRAPSSVAASVLEPLGQNTKPNASPLRGSYQYVRPEVRPYLLAALDAATASKISGKKLAEAGAAAPSTIANWRAHRTRSPQLVTILGTLRACGKDLEVVSRRT